MHNRFLRIGQEYSTSVADAVTGLHRQNGAANVGINVGANKSDVVANVVVNDVVNLSKVEECAVKGILRNPRISAAKLATILDVSPRQAQRIMASLKKKDGLRRRGADINGEWCFDENAELRNDGALAVAKRGQRK